MINKAIDKLEEAFELSEFELFIEEPLREALQDLKSIEKVT